MRFRPLLLAVLLAPLGCVHVDPGPMPMPSGASPLVNAPLPAGLPSSVTTATPVPSPMGSPARLNLTDTWAYGTTDEPPAGNVESCGNRVRLTDDGGAARLTIDGCGGTYEQATGIFDGSRLRLTGTYLTEQGEDPVAYDLTYDPKTEHFRGTRNGTAYWMARHVGMCVSPSILCSSILRGGVYDEAGGLVPGATVTVRSLNPSNPYEATIASVSGNWVAMHVPAGVSLEVSASKPGWATRLRTVLLTPWNGPQWLNFGGPASEFDPDGQAYPLLPAPSPSPSDAASPSE